VDQDKEDCLEGVVGLVLVAEDRAANLQHHRAMSLDQHRERALRPFSTTGQESLQEVPVRLPAYRRSVVNRAKMAEHALVSFNRHELVPSANLPIVSLNAMRSSGGSDFFQIF
jgi:hypothetical protein